MKQHSNTRDKAIRAGQFLLSLAVLITLWESAVHLLEIQPFLLPAPSAVIKSLYAGIASGLYIKHALITLYEAATGFVIAVCAAMVVGILVSEVRLVERFVYPYVVGLQSMPKIAIAPLIVLWAGYGLTSKVIVAAMIAFFPVLVNVIVGLRSAEADRLELMRSLDASRWQTFRYIRLPSALTYIFAGLKIAVVFSVLGAIVAEFVGSQQGLGNLILQFNFNLDVAGVFACLIILGCMGFALHALVHAVERRVIFWTQTDTHLAI